MSIGLIKAPLTFQRFLDRMLKVLDFVRVYLPDYVIFSKHEVEHMEHLRIVIERSVEAYINLKVKKCSFMQRINQTLVNTLICKA